LHGGAAATVEADREATRVAVATASAAAIERRAVMVKWVARGG